MRRTLGALLLLATALLTAGCGDDPPNSSGDSNPVNQQTKSPAPVATE